MCDGVGKSANISRADCDAYMQQQRQVCMFLSQDQVKRIHAALAVLATRGVSVLGSSGDGGSHFSFQPFDSDTIGSALNAIACEYQLPVFPTGSPYVLSIGGEDWQDGDSTQPIAWAGSGGGFANEFPQPAYQQATVAAYLQAQANSSIFPAPGTFAVAARAYPDVSAYATDGTSQSCPIFAGLVSMLIDHRLSAGLAPLGLLAPRVYAVAAQHPGEAFQDIQSGDTRQGCASGFPAAAGWDAVTGFGRPIWPGMLKYFGSD
jgi:tripeptidyl-peptidase-1